MCIILPFDGTNDKIQAVIEAEFCPKLVELFPDEEVDYCPPIISQPTFFVKVYMEGNQIGKKVDMLAHQNYDKYGRDGSVKSENFIRCQADFGTITGGERTTLEADVVRSYLTGRNPFTAGLDLDKIGVNTDNVGRKEGHVDYDMVHRVVYTHPEVASVGKTEEQ
ncbi:hypothetical protein IFM89_004132 [Coptis chinensis]|uniref:Uncharacterized protein n=1 Tax=Coptis chinensis TaxID=261450 RepID=A0A835H1S9_9MAGN|nr:hypothetical protein IFM89_004132 [Coptis chinensis]